LSQPRNRRRGIQACAARLLDFDVDLINQRVHRQSHAQGRQGRWHHHPRFADHTLRHSPEAWDYKRGNRSALEWILDQHKEKKLKEPTIREKFGSYRFADYKEKAIDLLMRITRVSVETHRITEAMRTAKR
jgi:hypothetical protein